jgi:hypothetical protein
MYVFSYKYKHDWCKNFQTFALLYKEIRADYYILFFRNTVLHVKYQTLN